MRKTTITALLLSIAALLLAVPPVMASSGQVSVFQDEGLLIQRGAAVRDRTLSRWRPSEWTSSRSG